MFQASQTLRDGWYASRESIKPSFSVLAATDRLHVVCDGWLDRIVNDEQATLEIEFMHQTLSRYVTSNTAKMLSDLYTKISQAYARRPGDENLQSNLDGVKRTLGDTRRRTGIEFLCFRPTKEKTTEKGERAERRERARRTSGSAREQRTS